MKRQWKMILCLVLILATLSSCAGQPTSPQTFDQATQYIGPAATDSPVPQSGQSIFANNPYDMGGFEESDALGEEGYVDDGVYDESEDVAAFNAYADPNATVYPYAGSTPIPLDPVDMPSPPPHAPLDFVYVDYTASIGITFQGPAGWEPDESINEQFILSEPESQIKDKQQAILKIYAIPVTSNYSEANLKTEVQDRLKTISSTNFDVWSPSLTATRHLMGGKGVYANYSGTMANGIKVGGRIHCTCIDKVLYCIEIVYPLAYKDDYLEVFSKMRSTIKRQ